MKNLILLNRLGFNPDLTTRQSRVDSVSNPCRCRVLATLLLCLTLFVGSGNVWGATYTITLKSNSSATDDGSTARTDLADIVSDGTDYVSSVSDCSRVFNGKSGYGIKFGAKSNAGYCTLNMSTAGQKKPTKITFNAARYGTDGTNLSYKINGGSAQTVTLSSGTTFDNYEVSMDGNTTLTSLYVGSASKRIYLKSITITYTDATPTHTLSSAVSPTGTGTVTLSETTVAEGSTATATATPNDGYRFSSWSISGTGASLSSTSTNPTTVTMGTANATVTATFVSKGCTDKGASSITSGASTDDDYGPVCAYNNYSTRQILYTKTDLDLAVGKKGTIKSIYFEYSGEAAMAARTIEIFMANTALTALSAGNCVPYASFTQVYSGTFSCGSAGWYEITLDTPFDYNGIGNLVVLIDDNTGSWASSKNFKYHSVTSPTPTNVQIYYNNDGTNINPSTTDWSNFSATNNRPNTKFCIQEADMTPATVTLMDNGATITEASAGAGVTLPSRAGCAGYTFAGWTKTWVAPQSSWTTTAPTIIQAGSYTPAGDENLYPVYTKEEGGGSGFKLSLNSGGTDYYIGAKGSGAYMSAVTNAANAIIFTFANGYLSFDDSGTTTYISSVGDNTTLTVGTSTPSATWTETGTTTATYRSSATGNRYLAFNSSANPVRFAPYGSSYAHEFTKHSLSTTYYISVPNCCTQLGTINGSNNLTTSSTGSSVTVSVKTAGVGAYGDANNVSGYEFKLYTASAGGSAAATYSSDSKAGTSHTFTELTPLTQYWVTVRPIGSGSYCNTTAESDRVAIYTCPGSPNHVDVSGRWDRFGGETISLTAAAYATEGTGTAIPAAKITGYQWQKWYNSQWNDISNAGTTSGATTNNLQITSCSNENSGSYRCVVRTVAGCDIASDGFQVKVYVLECYTGGTTIYNFIRIGDTQAGTCQITLAAGNHTFKFHADNDYYGNNGTINEDVSNWVCSTSQGDLTIAAGLGGTFTFTMDYSTGGSSSVLGEPEISVTYPRKTIYLTPGVWNVEGAKFAYYYYGVSGTGWTDFIAANECGMSAEIPQWNGIKVIAVRLNSDATVGTWDKKWNQTDDIALTADKNLITITDWDNSQTYTAYSIPTYTISYAKGSIPTGGVSISGSKADESKTCGVNFTLPAAQFTTTGYVQTGWSKADGGAQYAAVSGTYTDNAAQTFYPVWTANTHTLTWDANGGDALTGDYTSGTVAYATAITAPNTPTWTGHTFGGWHNGSSVVAPATSMPDNDLTYTAQWVYSVYNITYKDQGDVAYSGNATAGVPTGAPTTHTYGSATDLVDGVKDGYRFDGWFTDASCTVSAGSSIGATAVTADFTLYAKWTQVYTVTWSVNGDTWESGVVESNTHVPGGSKVSALPTAPTKSDCDDSKVFVGWRATEIDGTSVSDPGGIFTTQAGSPTISANTTFYAVFADESGGDITLVTNVSELTNGTQVYIYSESADVPAFTAVMKAYESGNNVKAVSGSVSGNKLTPSEGACAYTIGEVTVSATKYYTFNDGTYYLRATGTDKNYLVGAAALGDDEKGLFSISIDAGVFSITCKNTSVRGVMQFNKNGDTGVYDKALFACYSSASQRNVQLFKKNPLVHSNYVTTCSSCDADATFTNTTPAVSDIDCTSATLTATGGLATVGVDGCHVSDYGFVIGTSDNPVIGGSGVTKLQVGTSDPTIGADFSYDATGLTKGTRYYIRAYAINRHGTAYSSSTNFWTNNVSSIAITTAPTKTNYIVGETFDATGMVVTATMASGATEDVTSDVTYSSSALTAGTSQNFAINYSLCETAKSVNQVINVYTLSVSEGTNPSYGDYSTSANVITVNPGSGKTYSLSVTNATAVDNLDGTHTITNPTGNVTVTINYRDATTVKVYYKVDGKTVIEQDVTESTTATLPTASDVVTALAANDLELPEGTIYTNLWGWSESEFTPQTDEPTIVNSPTINATKTFYAVYTNMYKKSIVGSVFSGTYSDNDGEQTIDGLTYQVSNICKQSEQIQFRSTPGYLYSKTALSYIREIKISGLDLVVNACSDNSGTVDGSAITPVGTAPYIYTFPDNKQYFKITGNKGETDKVSRIDIYYATATPYYMTTFCDDKVAAPTVTDTKSYTATNKATVTLSWDEVSGATGYKVKWGSVSNSWEDVGTALTYSKENLSSGSTYKWFVKAKYDAENDCGAEIAKGSTTVNTAYEVAYDANTTGYTGTEPDGGFYESGETITVSSTALSKSRYHFDGWTPYNTSTSAAISVTTGTFTMPAADVLIQGGWTEVLSGDEVYITSAKDITTMSSMDIVVERATYKSGTMTISDGTGGQGGTFHAVIDGATADASDGLLATVKIEYTPNKANVTESATMTAVVGSESYDFTVYGRSLPTDFVIVAKVGAVWTALPADATTSGLQLGYSLTLDDATTPTKATLAPAAALFNYYAKSAKTTTDYIRLASKENSKALWSSTSNGIKVYAAIGGGSATGNQYEWKLSTNNNATYTLHNDAAGSGSGRDLGVNSDNKWGMHASATTSELRFLPVDATADYIAMTVISWGEYSFTFTTSDVIPSHDHVAVECNGVSYAASMTGSGPYTISIPLMDFSDYSGASLVVQWISDEDVVLAQGAVLMPIFITSDNTDFEGYDPDILAVTDVHITNGSTLTITTSGISVHDLSIEGGSTLNISKTAGDAAVTFGVHSLYLRGGWNETYTTYDMPRVYIDPKSTLTKSENAVNFDISVDSRNYYPFAVPFRVKVSDINYANSTLAYYAQYGAKGQYVIKEYDGARRAENGPDQQNNWKVVPKTDPESDDDVYLEPGRGYILTAVSLPAYGGGVIRIPLSFSNDWTKKGEQGTIDKSYYKNVVSVEAYAKAEGETKNANKGWNLLGVPFMSCYGTSADMGTDGVVMQGKFDFKTGEWKEEDVRYVNVPVHDFSEYIQVDMEDGDPVTVLRPGWCFFVQIEEDGNLTFQTADQAASSDLPIYAPKRGVKADMPTVKTGIILSGEEASDKTTFLVSDKYNGAEYEINADLEKMFGNGYTLATYSLSGETRLAYNALSNADAANVIPIGYRAPAEGEYTFSINPRYAQNGAFESVNLIDYETGIVTDLLQYSYTFSTGRTQNDSRFAINVVKQKETPTDIENIQGDNVQGTNVQKLLIDGKVYIIRGGQMYDATGKKVREINK